jgi:peptide/nickel transport system substrate-binding protein
MVRVRTSFARVASIAASALLVVVGAGAVSTGGAAVAAASTPVYGGTLNVGLSANPDSLNPYLFHETASIDVFRNIYQTLVDYNENEQVIPQLAKSWTISPNGLTYTFHLQTGVKWQNGTAFKATDVQASIEEAMQPTDTREAPLLTNVKSVVGNNAANTVTIYMKRKDYLLLNTLVDVQITPHIKGLNLATDPIGTGPFTFVKWIQNDEIVLKKNPYYWQKDRPYLNEIVYHIIPDPTTETLQLTTGQVDLVDGITPSEVPTVKADKNLTIYSVPEAQEPAPYFIVFNVRKGPLSNAKVREALSWAINRNQIKEDLQGYFFVEGSAFPPGNAFYDPKAISYVPQNLKLAKSLLAQAGYKSGFSITLKYFTVTDAYPTIAEVVAENWGQIGVKVTLQPVEIAAWVADVFTNFNFQAALTSNTPNDTPFDRINHNFVQYQVGTDWNDPTWFKDEEELRSINPASPAFRTMVNYLNVTVQQQEPDIIVGGVPSMTAASNNVHGFYADPRGEMRLWNVWLSK